MGEEWANRWRVKKNHKVLSVDLVVFFWSEKPFLCPAQVCTKEEMEVLSHNSNKSEKLRRKLLGNDEDRIGQGLDKAIQHRDKLLDYDKNWSVGIQ